MIGMILVTHGKLAEHFIDAMENESDDPPPRVHPDHVRRFSPVVSSVGAKQFGFAMQLFYQAAVAASAAPRKSAGRWLHVGLADAALA